MEDELKQASDYWTKAAQAKTTAASMKDPDMRQTMLQIAADYESIANTLQALHCSQATLKRLEEETS